MTAIPASDPVSDEPEPTRTDGILITWRESPRSVKALLLGVFVNRLAGFIQIFLVLFLTHRGFSTGEAGVALAVYGAGAVLGALAGGSLTDRLDARSATLISMVGSALLIVSFLYLRLYPLVLVAVLLASTVGMLYRPAAQSLITQLTPPRRLVLVTAMYRLALNLGTTAAPLLGAALVAVSYNLLFWGEAAAALVYALIAVTALPRQRIATRSGESTDTAGGPTTGQSRGYLAILADWRYSMFLLMMFVISVVYCQYTAALPLAITTAKLSLWWYGAVVSLNGFIVIVFELVLQRFVQKWPFRLTIFLGFFPVAVGYGLYAIGMIPLVLVLGTLSWTLAEIVGAPTMFSYPGMIAPEHLRGRYIGALQGLFGLGNTIGPVIGILLWNHVGQAVWLWAAGTATVATAIGQLAVRKPTAPASAEPVDQPREAVGEQVVAEG